MSDTERWERRSATVGADEKDAWLERAAAEGWELVAVVPAARARDHGAGAYYVILRRLMARPPG